MRNWNRQSFSRVVPILALLLGTSQVFIPSDASAIGFTQAYIRLDRMKAATTTGGTICATPASIAAEGKVVVTFPSTYTVNTTAANWTVTTSNLPAGSTPWIGITTASSATSPANVVTFTSGDLTVGTQYCFNFSGTNTLTTAAGAATSQQANVQTQTSGSVVIDYTNIALANITDDQIVVSAVVPPSFIFTISGNTDSFATNLDPASIVSTGGRTVTVTTNSKGGWIAWAKDSNQGLFSATTNYTVPTSGTVNGAVSTLVIGTEGYVLDTDLTTDAAGGCTLAIDPEYNGVGTTQGGTTSSVFQPIAACTGASPATANGDVITLIERAAISGATPTILIQLQLSAPVISKPNCHIDINCD
jgi:hypothetical protein